MKKIQRISSAMLLCSVSLSASAAVNATLDRDRIATDDSVQLTLQHDGNGSAQPDLAPLKKDFDILGSSTGSSIQIVNGRMSAQRELRLTLAPKRAGKLEVPPLSWDGEQSDALDLTVANGGADAQIGGGTDTHSGHVFLTSSLDQKQPYVQSGVVLTVRLHTDEPLNQASLDLSGNNEVLVQQLGKDQQGSETRGGHRYDVVERKYLLLPQRSGAISLEGPTLDAQVPDISTASPFGADSPFGNAFGGTPFAGMMNTTRPVRLHGDAIDLSVRPRPSAATGSDWLPARRVILEEAWRPDNASVHAGEPLTLHLRLSAEGQTGAQLPDLSTQLSLPDGIKAYPDQAKLDTSLQSGEVVGSRDQDIALIASTPGRYRLPALQLSWWDIAHDAQRQVNLPERTLDILPAAVGTSSLTPSPASLVGQGGSASAPGVAANHPITASAAASISVRAPWLWISAFLGVLWLGAPLAFWYRRRNTSRSITLARAGESTAGAPDASRARKAFQQACRDNDADAARRELLSWARAAWPDTPPLGLNALAQRLQSPGATDLLGKLDRACYSGGHWQGGQLAAALSKLPSPATARRKTPELTDLYP